MKLKVQFGGGSVAALMARERLFGRMHAHMSVKCEFGGVGLGALAAGVRLYRSMSEPMLSQGVAPEEETTAVRAFELFSGGV